jgi:uncharacterized cupin superfamily protein
MVPVMGKQESYPHLLRRNEILEGESTFSHPWNENSEITGTHLSGLTGLERTGVSLVRLASGKESFAYHMHHREEEWVYVLSGRGIAVIDGAEYEMGPGDFAAFPTPSVAHIMRNPNEPDLVYLMGGENREYEIADFPGLDKRVIRRGPDIEVFTLSDAKSFWPPD